MENNEDFEEKRNRLLIEGRWDELVEVLEYEKSQRSGSDNTEILEELGSIYLEHLHNPDLSFQSWDMMFRDQQNEDLMESYCLQILEKYPSYEPAIFRLEPLLLGSSSSEKKKKFAALLLDLADSHRDDLTTFLGYQRRASEIFEQLSDLQGAYLILSAALDERSLTLLISDLERLANLIGEVTPFISECRSVLVKMPIEKAAPLFKRLGLLALDAGLLSDAQDLLRDASASFPHDAEIRNALSHVHRRSGNWGGAIADMNQQLEKAADHVHRNELNSELKTLCENAAQQTAGLTAAKYYAQSASLCDDHQQIRQYWELALEQDASFIPAIHHLIDFYKDDPEKRGKLFETLIRRVDQEPNALSYQEFKTRIIQYVDLLNRRADLFSAFTKEELFRRAYELDPNDYNVAFDFGLALFEARDFDKARRVLTRLIKVKAPLERSKISTLFRVSASSLLYQAQNEQRSLSPIDTEDANRWIQQALSLQQDDLEAWQVFKVLSDLQGKIPSQIEARENLLRYTDDREERLRYLVDLGDLWLKAGRSDNAISALHRASKEQPGSTSIIRKQLAIFQKQKDWNNVISTLEALLDLEPDREKKTNLLYTIAILYRDELKNNEGAVHFFDASLEISPHFLKSFEAIDRIFTDLRLWKELERSYRKMLSRLKGSDDKDLKFLLFKNLGEVYRTRMNAIPEAIAAFETALVMRPNHQEITRILAQLHSKNGGDQFQTIEKLRDLLSRNPKKVETLESLYDAYLKEEEFDAAFCVAGAVQSLGGSFAISDYYTRYLSRNIKVASGRFYPELLEYMYHEKLDRKVSSILAILSYALRSAYGKTLKDWGVSEKEEMDLINPMHRFSKMFSYFSDLVGPKPPTKLYARVDHLLGIRNMLCDPPSILVGADMLDPVDVKTAAFQCGKMLSSLRPELYFAHAGFSVEHLNLFFVAAIDFGLGRSSTTGKNGKSVIKSLKKLPKSAQSQLARMVKQFDLSHPPNLSDWINYADASTSRFGLLVCGDIEIALKALGESREIFGERSQQQKEDSLLQFSISPHYFRVRKELGLSIN